MTTQPGNCRWCRTAGVISIVALGPMPLANALVAPGTPEPDPAFPLTVAFCYACGLAQLVETVPPSLLFTNYLYHSSASASWVEHARRFTDMATARLGLTKRSMVVEVASNDGYLLRHFAARDIPVLGIDPAGMAIAASARKVNVPTEGVFLTADSARALASRGVIADLLVANNVLGHVPDLDDFVDGLAILLKPGGTLTCEFPHFMRFVAGCQFDTIYHEHCSYLSLRFVRALLARHGLTVFDVEELPTHGGSLRVWASRDERPVGPSVARVLAAESAARLDDPVTHRDFATRVRRCLDSLRAFLDRTRADGRSVAAYGAAAKGAMLLNAAGVTLDEIAFVADIAPQKQGLLLPGCRIPVVSPQEIFSRKPEILLVLPWNLIAEIRADLVGIAAWGGRFAVAVPELEVLP